MATTTTTHHPLKPLDLDLTIISAKHLKNVNWRNGDLTPYTIFWLDPNHRLATKSDDSNSTKPVWNERFLIPLPPPPTPTILTLEIFHSKPSDTPKPLVGTLRIPINDLPNPQDFNLVRTYDLRRPSGRVHGKIRLKLAVRDRPVQDYQITHPPAYYYNTAPASVPPYGRYPPSPSPYTTAPPPPRPYLYGSNSDPYSGYYQGGYYPNTQSNTRGYTERPSGYEGGGVGGPSVPVDYAHYEQKQPQPVRQSGDGDGDGSGVGGPSAPVDYAQYDHKQKIGNVASGLGLGMEVGVTPQPTPVRQSGYGNGGGVGGPSAPVDYAQYEEKRNVASSGAVDEGLRYEDEKIRERVESDVNARELDDYSGYRRVGY
ncbi:putative C2 domain-containing protein [Helianthus annuus]|nr:putative C2 domain-containing protein [Helianthus annuus]KAJ0732501.1 putative C2 domain-containing protein [Helianthus annuus]KAJ0906143.1 putative C2 domain-containing protein [Helianthus annuus]